MTTIPQIMDALRPVIDPELDISIVDLGLVRRVDVDKDTGTVIVRLTLTSPACPMGPQILQATHFALAGLPDRPTVDLSLVWDPPWDPETDMDEDARAELGYW